MKNSGFIGKHLERQVLAILVVTLFAATAAAQIEDPPLDVVPPPLSKLSKETIKQIEAETSISDRTKLVIELMEARLEASQGFAEQSEFSKSLDEVGAFRGLMYDMRTALLNERPRPSLKNNKRFEIALRKFVPNLERIRRDLPFRYGYHVRRLIDDIDSVREELQDSFFADI